MDNKQPAYAVGDLVFAKIKNFRHWPATITKILNVENKPPKFELLFFGDNTTSKVNSSNLFPYLDNLPTFGQPLSDNFRNKLFNKALLEADTAHKACQTPNTTPPSTEEKIAHQHGQHPMEDICSKVEQLQNTDDLKSSLTLAAEKLRQDVLDLTFKNSQLLGNLKQAEEMKFEMRIEELEKDNETLTQRNLTLVDTLRKAEEHLAKERRLREVLAETFEEQDLEKETLITNQEKEINRLQAVVKKQKRMQTEESKKIYSTDVLAELAQLKNRQEGIEKHVLNFQTQLDNNKKVPEVLTNPQSSPVRPSSYPAQLNQNKKGKTSGDLAKIARSQI
ncbi:PC4 and SFRS1-interacting protein [Homalodisca vitripennis]|nr:PC4 and SFRS1-interacting protein [Homalodisca vitripennis]